jgi:hypothetical protein
VNENVGRFWRAVAIDDRAHFLIDVEGPAAGVCCHWSPDAPDGNGASAGYYQPAGGLPAMHEEFVRAWFARPYQWPVFGIEVQGSAGGLASPFCKSSIECRSGERTKAIWPSRGGRLMVMPIFISRSQVA